MARRKNKKSRRLPLIWFLLSIVTGGGVGGYARPDLPVIGPIVTKLVALKDGASQQTADGVRDQITGELLSGRPVAGAALDRYRSQSGTRPTDGTNPSYGANRPLGDGAGGQQIGAGRASVQAASSQRPADKIYLASFNIQVLGKSKMSKPEVVEILAHAIRQFDLVAIQEVRAKDDDILPQLVGAVNADGSQYSFVIGPRLGRTVSTEQYAFVFDTTRIEHDPSSVGTIQDPNDRMHREPLVTRFRARTNQPDRGFTFWLVNAHTDPDEVPTEVAALAEVFQVMQKARPDEDDVILLGDLNADETQLGPLGKIPGIHWAIRGVMTNTRKNHAYDNILFQSQATAEYTGRWGVYDFENIYKISREQALKVSDHMPVWAEFGVWEAAQPNRFADRLLPNRR